MNLPSHQPRPAHRKLHHAAAFFRFQGRADSPASPAEDRVVAVVLGVLFAAVLLLGLRELPHWLREQRSAEQRRAALVRAHLELPAEARITHYKSWRQIEHHLRFTLPATHAPEVWLEQMAGTMGLPRQSRQNRHTWAGEHIGVAYEPATRDFRVYCTRLSITE